MGKSGLFKVRGYVSFRDFASQKTCNGGFCVVCFLFAKHQPSLGQLVTSAMTNFTRAKLTLQEHSKQKCAFNGSHGCC